MAPDIRVIGDKMLVKRLDTETVSEGGIHIPDRSQDPPKRGVVLKLGQGREIRKPKYVLNVLEEGCQDTSPQFAPFQCCVGDHVIFNKYGGREIEHNGETYLVIPEGEVLARIAKEDLCQS